MNTTVRNSIIVGVCVLVLIGAFYAAWAYQNGQGSKLEPFAKCIKDKGFLFYGAFWCPHCQNQKSLFGSAAQFLPYVECSTPDSNGQLQVCIDQKIEVYPTWKLPDGTMSPGELTLKELADKSGCTLP